jgi:hypothetical protein
MDTIGNPQHFQHFQHHLQQQQQTQQGIQATKLQTKIVETQPSFTMFRPLELPLPINTLGCAKGQPFEFNLRS